MLKCPWARYWTPNCSPIGSWHLAWPPLPSVCAHGWMWRECERSRNPSLFIKRHHGVLNSVVKLTNHGISIGFHSGPSSVKGRTQHHLKPLGYLIKSYIWMVVLRLFYRDHFFFYESPLLQLSVNISKWGSIIMMGRDTNVTPSWQVLCFSIYQWPWAHRGGNTLCGLGKRHSNRWLDAIARGPLFFLFWFFFFFLSLQFWLPDPMIPIWVSVRAAIHHWLDYLVGREQRAIHLRSWHNPGQSDAMLPALPPLLMQLLQDWALETHMRTQSSLLHRRCMYVEMWNVTWVAAHWENAKLKSKKEKKTMNTGCFMFSTKRKKIPQWIKKKWPKNKPFPIQVKC